jgi:hypothetical protein
MLPYTGTIAVTGTPAFNGDGHFKFAIVNNECQTSPFTGCASFWSNDLSKIDGSEPTTAVKIPVTNGVFAAKLGDQTLSMQPIPATVFDNQTTFLRVWFSDNGTTFEQLSPDRQLVSVPYAFRAELATRAETATRAEFADQGVPAGSVMFFNLPTCPSGWTELTAAQGRYLVGLPSGGTLAGTQGTALANLENRATGQHTHNVVDPGHSHNVLTDDPGIIFCIFPNCPNPSSKIPAAVSNINPTFSLPNAAASRVTGITIQGSGTVIGTNAPYLQLLVCQKT